MGEYCTFCFASLRNFLADSFYDTALDHHASLQVEVLNEEDAFSGEFRLDRVRVFVDGQGIVASEPRLG